MFITLSVIHSSIECTCVGQALQQHARLVGQVRILNKMYLINISLSLMHILGFTECLCILRDYLEQINSNTLTAEMVLGVYNFKPAIYVYDWSYWSANLSCSNRLYITCCGLWLQLSKISNHKTSSWSPTVKGLNFRERDN